MGAALMRATALVGTVLSGIGARETFRIAGHAPAVAEDPVVPLHELRERPPQVVWSSGPVV